MNADIRETDQTDQPQRCHLSVDEDRAVAADMAAMNADQREQQRGHLSVKEERAVAAPDFAAMNADHRDQHPSVDEGRAVTAGIATTNLDQRPPAL
eukprot:11630130-Karenia_brevis.AAC.1